MKVDKGEIPDGDELDIAWGDVRHLGRTDGQAAMVRFGGIREVER